MLAFDDRWRELAAFAPYEFVEIVVNERKYGGGGIYNLYATVAADNAFTPYVFVHEFGHHFAGLADEYYTSDVAYETGQERVEPWEPNATADPRAVKWKSLMAASAPLPTPWAQGRVRGDPEGDPGARRKIRAEGRPEAEMEALFREESARTAPLLAQGPHAARGGGLRGRPLRGQGATTARAPTASCSRATRWASARCAGGPSSGWSTCTLGLAFNPDRRPRGPRGRREALRRSCT